MTDMKLLVCIISNEKKLEDILEALIEEGFSGGSILDVRGMFDYLTEEIPLFAGFRSLIEHPGKTHKMIISVIKDTQRLHKAMDVIEEAYGGFSDTNTGIMFAVKVSDVRGIKF